MGVFAGAGISGRIGAAAVFGGGCEAFGGTDGVAVAARGGEDVIPERGRCSGAGATDGVAGGSAAVLGSGCRTLDVVAGGAGCAAASVSSVATGGEVRSAGIAAG